MTCALDSKAVDGLYVYRLGRQPDPWSWPDPAYSSGTNRWDDPTGTYRVLYAATQRVATFVETMARFRQDPIVAVALAEIADDEEDEDLAWLGKVPRDWLTRRAIGTALLTGNFAEVSGAQSLSLLRRRMASRLDVHGLTDLDASAIRISAPRRFTQEISRLIYECTSGGARQFDGIYYRSRFGDEFDNWALFEPLGESTLNVRVVAAVEADDPDLLTALDILDLALDD